MKKILLSIAAASALAMASAPAMAQPYGAPHGGPSYGERGPDRGFDMRSRVDRVLAKVDRAIHSGRLTRSERTSLSYRATKLSNLQRQYERGGLSGYERAALDREANDLDNRIDRAIRF